MILYILVYILKIILHILKIIFQDSLGLHRVENPSAMNPAVSLHLYSPPFSSCSVFNKQTGQKSMCKVTFWSKYGERRNRVRNSCISQKFYFIVRVPIYLCRRSYQRIMGCIPKLHLRWKSLPRFKFGLRKSQNESSSFFYEKFCNYNFNSHWTELYFHINSANPIVILINTYE